MKSKLPVDGCASVTFVLVVVSIASANATSLRRSSGVSALQEAAIHADGTNPEVSKFISYTDCSSQQPTFEHLSGSKAPRIETQLQGSSPAKVPGQNLALCFPPKNGCTYWKALLMKMDGNPLWDDPRPQARHSPQLNGLQHSLDYLATMDSVMLVRNPIARVLSAFLDKASDTAGHYSKMLGHLTYDSAGFSKFIQEISDKVLNGYADSHWRLQSDHCGLQLGATYDLYLKVECRTIWSPAMFKRYSMTAFTASGWGANGTQPFIPPGAVPSAVPGMKANDPEGTHDNRADDVKKICKWYTQETFLRAVALYIADISAFNYNEDVQRLAAACGYSDELKSMLTNPDKYNFPTR